jgi:hypothetical protein
MKAVVFHGVGDIRLTERRRVPLESRDVAVYN